jgi:NDP-sugar pyrophosphorylase family protein
MADVTGTDPPRPAGVVLAAGAGSRLAPLTRLRPKALCPVGDRALVDHALDRLQPAVDDVAVNVHHGRLLMEAHLTRGARSVRPHVSVEEGEARGTAGALGVLRDWIDGRPVLVTNSDAWLDVDVGSFVAGWDGERTRLLCVRDPARGDFGTLRYCGLGLLPWSEVSRLGPEPSGLYERSWARAERDGRLDLVVHEGSFVDCGTAADYLDANLGWSAGANVVGEGCVVAPGARVERSVLWPGAVVRAGEVLVEAVRAGTTTVLVRRRRQAGRVSASR